MSNPSKYIPKTLRKHGDELKTEQQNSLVLNNYGTFDPKRKPLESIHDWRKRLIAYNNFGYYGGELAPAVVTADRTDQQPTGNWFQRVGKFIRPYGSEADTYKTYLRENDELDKQVKDATINLYPSEAYNLFEKVKNYKGFMSRLINRDKRIDEYRGKYASSILPFKKHPTQNDILAQMQRWYSRKWGYLHKSQENFSRKGTDIVDLSKNVIRLSPDSKQSTALFNEFVETKNPSVRSAREYQSGKISTFGDRNIPVQNVSLYAGIEDGHFKLDSLNNFNPETMIYPARNIKRNTLPISKLNINGEFHSSDGNSFLQDFYGTLQPCWWGWNSVTADKIPDTKLQSMKEYEHNALNRINSLLEENKVKQALEELGYSYTGHETADDVKHFISNLQQLRRFVVVSPEVKSQTDSLTDLKSKVYEQIYGENDNTKYTYTDINGNIHPISDYKASVLDNKTILVNPNGGLFIGKFQDISPAQLDSINNWLANNPSHLLLGDLGSFSQYRIDDEDWKKDPSLKNYLKQYFEHPKADDPNVYTVGTTEPNKKF